MMIQEMIQEKAIPIKWIRDYLAQWDSVANRYERPFEDDVLEDKEYWNVINKRASIGAMLATWLREQGNCNG